MTINTTWGPQLDQAQAGILQRYSKYNGTESNSKTAAQSQAALGIATSASTSLPDAEDVDRDNNMNQDDEYFQYQVPSARRPWWWARLMSMIR